MNEAWKAVDMALGRDNINGPIAPLETRIELDQDFVRLLNWCREVSPESRPAIHSTNKEQLCQRSGDSRNR